MNVVEATTLYLEWVGKIADPSHDALNAVCILIQACANAQWDVNFHSQTRGSALLSLVADLG